MSSPPIEPDSGPILNNSGDAEISDSPVGVLNVQENTPSS